MRINNQLYVTLTGCFKNSMKNYYHSSAIHCLYLNGTKLKLLTSLLFILTSLSFTYSQTYSVQYRTGNDSLSAEQKKFVQTSFTSRAAASQYLFELPSSLHS